MPLPGHLDPRIAELDFHVVPGVNLIKKPANLPFVEAACVPLVFLTAWHMLVDRCGIKPGDSVLVHAGGSGVGSAAIQIAKLHGAEVITTASTRVKLELAEELGADHLINYEEEDFAKAVRRITKKRGVDVVFEHTGEATWPGSLMSVARGGKIVTCGATSGFQAVSDLRIVFFKQVSILGSTMGSMGEVLTVMAHVAAGRLRPVLDRAYPLADVADAHRHLEGREQFGKVVVVPGE